MSFEPTPFEQRLYDSVKKKESARVGQYFFYNLTESNYTVGKNFFDASDKYLFFYGPPPFDGYDIIGVVL